MDQQVYFSGELNFNQVGVKKLSFKMRISL
jgi:hypothetical protein